MWSASLASRVGALRIGVFIYGLEPGLLKESTRFPRHFLAPCNRLLLPRAWIKSFDSPAGRTRVIFGVLAGEDHVKNFSTAVAADSHWHREFPFHKRIRPGSPRRQDTHTIDPPLLAKDCVRQGCIGADAAWIGKAGAFVAVIRPAGEPWAAVDRGRITVGARKSFGFTEFLIHFRLFRADLGQDGFVGDVFVVG